MRGRPLRSSSVHTTAASVRPASSSTSWALMPRLERKMEIRGRVAAPRPLARARPPPRRPPCPARAGAGPAAGPPSWRRSCPLAHLPGDVLALVADALALVGLGRALLADVGGPLAHELLVDAPYDHARGLGHLELDAVGRLHRHGVGVAERQLEV